MSARARLEIAIGALVVASFVRKGGDVSNHGLQALHLTLDRSELFEQFRVVLGAHNVKLLVRAGAGTLFGVPYRAATNTAP